MLLRRLMLLGVIGCALVSWLVLAAPARAPAGTPLEAPGAPAGFVEMTVQGVMPTDQGTAVILKLDKEGILLPIWIGETEAFSIGLRLERRRFERPLTHDLLDNIVHELGGQIVKIQVDDLKSNTFVGTVFIRQGGRIISVDSRPSDAIALAIGNRVPIFVSRKVLDQAGVKQDGEKMPSEKPAAEDQEKLLKDIIESGKDEKTL